MSDDDFFDSDDEGAGARALSNSSNSSQARASSKRSRSTPAWLKDSPESVEPKPKKPKGGSKPKADKPPPAKKGDGKPAAQPKPKTKIITLASSDDSQGSEGGDEDEEREGGDVLVSVVVKKGGVYGFEAGKGSDMFKPVAEKAYASGVTIPLDQLAEFDEFQDEADETDPKRWTWGSWLAPSSTSRRRRHPRLPAQRLLLRHLRTTTSRRPR
jgi:hypothetical protein